LPSIAIYRDRLLPYAQRFIGAQLSRVRRHRLVFVGTRVLDRSRLQPGARVLTPSSALGAWRMTAGLGAPAGVLRELRREHPLLVHAQFGTDGIRAAPLAAALAVPLLVTFRGFDIARRPASSAPYWIYSRLRRRLYGRAHTVIAVCRHLAEMLAADGCPPDKIEVVYNGIDPADFAADPAARRGEEVLFVGRLVEKKGADTLVRAMRHVQKQRPAAKLVLLGDGPEAPRIASLARAEGVTVEMPGAQAPASVRAWMSRARVFCLPSRTARDGDAEGLPNVILESQALGLPVVSTRHAGIPEAVVDGTTGFLVGEGDVAALADRILQLFADEALWQAVAAAARRSVEERFDARRHVERLESLYERAARPSALRA